MEKPQFVKFSNKNRTVVAKNTVMLIAHFFSQVYRVVNFSFSFWDAKRCRQGLKWSFHGRVTWGIFCRLVSNYGMWGLDCGNFNLFWVAPKRVV